jgi:apolipoprotein N-acyltransferase
LALIAASAVLQILLFPLGDPDNLVLGVFQWFAGPLSWIALVPFLVAILLPNRSGRQHTLRESFALGYVCGILWYAGNCYWIYQTMYLYGGLPKPVAFGILILFALYLGLYHALFAVGLNCVSRSRFGVVGALAAAPFLWVTIELARSRITGFPWDLLGNCQIDNLFLTRIAPYAGVMGISFFLVAVNAAVTSYFFVRGKKRFAIPITVFLLVAFLQLEMYSGSFKSLQEPVGQTAIMLQENLEVGALAKSQQHLRPEEELSTFASDTLHPYVAEPFSGVYDWNDKVPSPIPAVLIWPEAPSHLQSNDPAFRAAISDLARTAHAPAIVGSLGVDFSPASDRGYFLYDSASLFDAAGTYTGRYDKVHLVPWGEYIPFKQFFAFARKLTEGVGDMDRGSERSVFTTAGRSYGIFICYESIFGDEVRQFALNGAQVFVNISDDGWYGDTGAPWQHLNMTRMRAIENDRWILLDTNTGITTAIDPHGHTRFQAPRHTRAAYAFPFAFRSGTTFYTRHGDWFAWLCFGVTLLTLSITLGRP